MSNLDLKKKTFYSIIWASIPIVIGFLINLGVFAVLARLLSPVEFGLYALAAGFFEFTKIVAVIGLTSAIVRRSELDEELADTAFWANVALSVLMTIATWFLAGPYSLFVNHEEVAPILRVLALIVPIAAFGAIHAARKLREFGHKAIAGRMILGGAIGGSAGIVAALNGFGVWSFVIQLAVNELTASLVAWYAFPWLPRLRFSWTRLREISRLATHLSISQVSYLLLARAPEIIIGRFIGAAAVGGYRVAWRCVDLIAQATVQPISNVSLVTFSRLQSDKLAFANAYRRMVGLAAMIGAPIFCGFAAVAKDLVPLLFGEKWADSAQIAQILAAIFLPRIINILVNPALASIGRSDMLLRIALLQAPLLIVFLLIAVPFGLKAIAFAFVFRSYLILPHQLFVLKRAIGIEPMSVVRVILPPLVAALCMAGLIVATEPFVRQFAADRLSYVAVATLMGIPTYAALLLLFGRSFLMSQLRALRPVFEAQATTVPADPVALGKDLSA